MKFKLSKLTWVVSGHTSTLNKSPLWWKVKAKKVQRNISGATLDEERRIRSSGSGVATRKVEATVGIWVSFFFSVGLQLYTLPADFQFPANIRYFSRNGRYIPVWPGIWSGTKQSYFRSGLSTSTANKITIKKKRKKKGSISYFKSMVKSN